MAGEERAWRRCLWLALARLAWARLVRHRWPLAALALAQLTAACAHLSDIDAFPPRYRQRLAAHPAWLTILTVDNEPGDFPPSEVAVVKKWRVETQGAEAQRLIGIRTSSLLGVLDRLRVGASPFDVADLRERLSPAVFFPVRSQVQRLKSQLLADSFDFVDIDAERFQIRINGGQGRIVFVPAPERGTGPAGRTLVASDGDAASLGVWTTPFGAESELLFYLKKTLLKDDDASVEEPSALGETRFLHHDLRRQGGITVVIDPSFPSDWRPAVAQAAQGWNAAFASELLRLAPAPQPVNDADCLSSRRLCIRWYGPHALPLTGANGYTQMAFDPDTGVIMGGVIAVINDDVTPPLRPLSRAEAAHVARPTKEWVAGAMLRFSAFNGAAHPYPKRYLEYLLLHEMGHFHGLGHNFITSDATTSLRPVTTVMTYPPFPVAHNANRLGDDDLARIDLIYRAHRQERHLRYCSTFEAMAPERDEHGYYRKTGRCDMFTLGNLADWYIALARHAAQGVLTPYPDLSELSEEVKDLYDDMARKKRLPPLNLLTRLALVLGDPSSANAAGRGRIQRYLCGQKGDLTAIRQQLALYHGLSVVCGRAAQ